MTNLSHHGDSGKLSERLLELLAQAVKKEDSLFLEPVFHAALFLSVVAWNRANGDDTAWKKRRRLLENLGWDPSAFQPHLVSQDLEVVLNRLVAFKKANYPEDKRIIRGAYLEGEKGALRVEWEEPPKNGIPKPAGPSPHPPFPPGEGGFSPAREGTAPKGSIGAKLREEVLREKRAGGSHGNVVDFSAFKSFQEESEKALQEIVSLEKSKKLPPGFRVYVHAFNVFLALAEKLLHLKELSSLGCFLDQAEEEYMPGWPPMSPVSSSFFTSWSLLDAWTGPRKETLASIFLDSSEELVPSSEMRRIFRILSESRMGVYAHEGAEGKVVSLRELVTDHKIQAVSPNGFTGRKGELWFVRALPPPAPQIDHHVILNSPYVLVGQKEADWNEYFDRNLASSSRKRRIASYERRMKYGPNRKYWLEYIMDAYRGHTRKAIYLTGIPDLPETLPHYADPI